MAVDRPRSRRALLVAAMLAAFGALIAGCASTPGPAGQSHCMPAFPYQDGWLGADSAYSVPLSERETLWLFGDTFVGEPGQPDRRGARFIHNSIARSHCDERGSWSIRYHWGQGLEGPGDFLDRGDARTWWWLSSRTAGCGF